MPRLSVITPFHNTPEDLFQACVDSVLSQGMADFEWIIIDDGSEEKSAKFLKDFCERDSRIRLIVQEASGVSVARNRGLEEKAGEFFTFVDSDDIISPNFFEEALETATRMQADIVYGMLSDTRKPLSLDSISKISEYAYRGKDKDLLLRSVISGRDLLGGTQVAIFRPFAVAPRLYRSESFPEARFETSMTLGEDSLFNACTIDQATTVILSPHLWYTYVIHGSSSVYSHLSHDQALAMLSSFNRYREVAKEKEWSDSDIGMRFLDSFLHILTLYTEYASVRQINNLIDASVRLSIARVIPSIHLPDYFIDGLSPVLRTAIATFRYDYSWPLTCALKVRQTIKKFRK